MFKKPFVLIFFLLGFLCARGQQNATPAEKDVIKVDKSDRLEYFSNKGLVTQKLIGNVWLHQDSVFMYCDSALIENGTKLRAFGHVIIQQTDSVAVFSDSLVYNSVTKIADLYADQDVVLKTGSRVLYAWKTLNYNVGQRIGSYRRGGKIFSDKTQIFSREGEYFVNSKEVFFKNKVFVNDRDFTLKTDTLQYNIDDKMAIFLAPTRIRQDSSDIYCERGYYDFKLKKAEFLQNPQFRNNKQRAVADTIRYDGTAKEIFLSKNARFQDSLKVANADTIVYSQTAGETRLIGHAFYKDEKQQIAGKKIRYNNKTESFSTEGRSVIGNTGNILEADHVAYDKVKGTGMASGNVVWRDTTQKISIRCEAMDYNRDRNYLKTRGKRPLMITLINNDSLYLSADTLVSEKNDSIQSMKAYHDVRIYKRDLSGTCDSLYYSDRDSTFRLFRAPILWSDTTQFSADTIHLSLADKKLNKISLFKKSFIINGLGQELFNQIRGRNITAFFAESRVSRMKVDGNAESVYFATDDKNAYIGINKVKCSEMTIHWADNKVKKIDFFAQPKGNITPLKSIRNFNQFRLPGFNWDPSGKPMSVDDLLKPKLILPVRNVKK